MHFQSPPFWSLMTTYRSKLQQMIKIKKHMIIQQALRVAYDETHDQQVSHKDIKYLTQAHNQEVQPK